ncbi:MAG: hypothetical protein SGBAC_011251 [Bacillariaceae sp.]
MNYKDNLVEKVGGQSQFDFIVIKYCEIIQDDLSLRAVFADLQLDGLIDLQKEFLDAALLDLPSHITEVAMGRLIVKYQHLWQSGLNESNFNLLKAHFTEALRDCWVEDKLISLFEQHYDSLRPLFQDVMSDKKAAPEPVAPISIAQRSGIRSRLGGVNGSRRI